MATGAERTRKSRIRTRLRNARAHLTHAQTMIPAPREAAHVIANHLRNAQRELEQMGNPFHAGIHPDSIPSALVEWARNTATFATRAEAALIASQGELALAIAEAESAGIDPNSVQ